MSTTDPDFYAGRPRDPELEARHRAAADAYDREQAAKYQAMKAEVAAEIAAMDGHELSEAVEHAETYMSEARAEYGMGAVSMGFDPYEVTPFEAPRTSEFIAQGKARLRELYPPIPAAAVSPVAGDDLPF